MSRDETRKMGNGLYRLFWKSGGVSLAAVGSLHDGTKWFAPTNWTAKEPDGVTSTNWRIVDRVEKLALFAL